MTFDIPEHIKEALKKNKKRYINATDLPQVAKKTCKWCCTPLSGRRTAWCSKECTDKLEKILRTADPYLLERSNGKCEICGYLVRIAYSMQHKHFDAIVEGMNQANEDCFEAYANLFDLKLDDRIGLTLQESYLPSDDFYQRTPRQVGEWIWKQQKQFDHCWEVDHVIPLSENGWSCPTNMRILCIPCHKLETKALAKRRAQSRKSTTQS